MSGRLLLSTDLDRTLLPNGSAPESVSARSRFASIAARPEVVLAYVTGRHRELVQEAIDEFELPRPDYLIGDVGTSLFELRGADWRPWLDWQARLAEDWDPGMPSRLRRTLADVRELQPQEAARQGRFKLSYFAPAEPAPWLESVRARLGPDTRAIFSRDERQRGLLDLVPASGGKLAALEFLRHRLEIDRDRTLFAGDSGNDLEVLASDLPAVLVRNASDDVRRRALELAAEAGTSQLLFLARGELRDLNGNYAAGILEGLIHFWPEALAWID